MGQGSIEPGCNLQLRVLVRASRDTLGVGDLATPQRCAALVSRHGGDRLEADGAAGCGGGLVAQPIVAAVLPGEFAVPDGNPRGDDVEMGVVGVAVFESNPLVPVRIHTHFLEIRPGSLIPVLFRQIVIGQ